MTKELIYEPKTKAKIDKSRMLGLAIFAKIGALSLEYVFKSIQKKTSLLVTKEYIERFWRINFSMSHTTVYSTGREHLIDDQPYIYLSNHTSWMDFSAIFATTKGHLRMVSKQELMNIPIFGHAMQDAGFIAVDRKNRTKAIEQLEIAKERLKEGISIWMSPEGTRSRTGVISPFKKGGFYLALELNIPIVPVYIEGALEVMPPDDMMVYTNRNITVHFLPPIYPKNNMQNVIEEVRNAIVTKQKVCQESF